jgi:hypothetical protein
MSVQITPAFHEAEMELQKNYEKSIVRHGAAAYLSITIKFYDRETAMFV